jgi:3-deoxy-7-phosphoheptulonate synthase
MTTTWTPDSWQKRPALQQPNYDNPGELTEALKTLSQLPPLVTAWEVDRLRGQLAAAGDGNAFVLQGGDCSESFDDCNSGTILRKLKVLIQMSLVLICGSKKRIVRVGRIAGQYAKPRSADMEKRGDIELPSYRGDIVNRSGFTPAERRPDPQLMLRAYERSSLTINYIRALSEGGFADLHHPENWDLEFVRNTPGSRRYQQLLESLSDSIRFMEAVSQGELTQLTRVDFFTSHEALLLLFEQALTRMERQRGWYNLGTHMAWIGDRTRAIDGAHIEYFRGIRNPIGLKVGNSMVPDELIDVIRILNPDNEPGRLTLIHRLVQKKSDPGCLHWLKLCCAPDAKSCGAVIRCMATAKQLAMESRRVRLMTSCQRSLPRFASTKKWAVDFPESIWNSPGKTSPSVLVDPETFPNRI